MKQEIHFVTGKGGVGKSAVAAALALKKSREGLRTLLIEMGDQSFFQDYFELPSVRFKPAPLRENLDVALWSGQDCLREYALYLIKVEALYRLFFENAVMRAFINVAPALPELAIMGKVTSGPRHHGPPLPYDCLVVDSFATGHFMALMRAAPGMAKAVQFGPMGEQSRGIDQALRDPSLCHYHIVTLPEELPLKEAAELMTDLQKEFQIKASLLLNKILQTSLQVSELQSVEASSSDLKSFAEYIEFQLRHQDEMKKRARELDPAGPQLPLVLETDSWKVVEKIAEVLP